MKLTHERIKKLLHYDPGSGVFTRRVSSAGTLNAGTTTGYVKTNISGKRYCLISINGKQYSSHRLAFLHMTGSFPKDQVDHIDGNGTNNAWINLRQVSHLENQKNKRLHANNKSGIAGVRQHEPSKKWHAYIMVEQKFIFLGSFEKKSNAAKARKLAEAEYGFHENHGQRRAL